MKLKQICKQSSTKDGLYAYSLHISVEACDDDSAESSDPNVFVFRRSVPTFNPNGPTDGVVDDVFFNVATPVDMYDIPVKRPDVEHGMPYYRDSELDLWFRNLEDLDRAKEEVTSDIASLCGLCNNFSSGAGVEETVVHDGTHERIK